MENLIEIFLEQAEITEENYNKEIFETKFLIFIDDFSKKIISNLNENLDELVTYEKKQKKVLVLLDHDGLAVLNILMILQY
jgi:hypothetical protein